MNSLSLVPFNNRITVITNAGLNMWGDPIEGIRTTVPSRITVKTLDDKTVITAILRSDVKISIADAVEYRGKVYQVVSVENIEDMAGNILNVKITAR